MLPNISLVGDWASVEGVLTTVEGARALIEGVCVALRVELCLVVGAAILGFLERMVLDWHFISPVVLLYFRTAMDLCPVVCCRFPSVNPLSLVRFAHALAKTPPLPLYERANEFLYFTIYKKIYGIRIYSLLVLLVP